jgi:hypothetical protein
LKEQLDDDAALRVERAFDGKPRPHECFIVKGYLHKVCILHAVPLLVSRMNEHIKKKRLGKGDIVTKSFTLEIMRPMSIYTVILYAICNHTATGVAPTSARKRKNVFHSQRRTGDAFTLKGYVPHLQHSTRTI